MREDHDDLLDTGAKQWIAEQRRRRAERPSFHMVEDEASSRLSEPDPTHPAHQLAAQMHQKLDQALKYSIKELDQLSASIEKYKVELAGRTQIIKDAISEHFDFTTEVMGFKEKADRRLEELSNGTHEEKAAVAAEGGRRATEDGVGLPAADA